MSKLIWHNNYFKYTFWSLIIADIFFFLAHSFVKFEFVLFIFVSLFLFYLMFKRPVYIVYISLLELFVGSHGHLMDLSFSGFIISLRMMIFILAFLSGTIYCFKKRRIDFLKSSYFSLFLGYLIMLFLASSLAFIKERSLGDIFLDLNGYLFILILPIFYQISRDYKIFKDLLYIFLASSLFFSLKTILTFYIFSHHFSGINLTILYEWLRDSRIGEITMLNPNFFRIFFQSQIYILVSFILIFSFLVLKIKKINIKNQILLIILSILNLSVILISLSRSYWLGLIMFLLTLFVFLMFKKYRFLNIVKIYLKFLLILILSSLFVFLLVKIPYTNTNLDDLFKKRLTSNEAASNSRLELLPHMLEKIKEHPIIGNGLAQEITYMSYDPRNRNKKNPDGSVTTYSFEWGWLSIWMKFGIFGLFIYLYLILKIISDSVKLTMNTWPNFDAVLMISLSLALLSIVSVHIFSPYLDHPLGISFILVLIMILEKTKLKYNQIIIK